MKLEKPWPSMPIDQHTAEEAYKLVLAKAGAILPERDEVDARIIGETRSGFATYEGKAYEKDRKVANPDKASGIIDSQHDAGGWPVLKSAPAPKDTDHDGMQDDWEDRKSTRLNSSH